MSKDIAWIVRQAEIEAMLNRLTGDELSFAAFEAERILRARARERERQFDFVRRMMDEPPASCGEQPKAEDPKGLSPKGADAVTDEVRQASHSLPSQPPTPEASRTTERVKP